MKRETKTRQVELEGTHSSSVRPVCSRRTRLAMTAGLAVAFLQLVVPSALAGGASPLVVVVDAADGKRPRTERHVELRKVLSAPRESGAGGESRRKLSAEERNALRESMRGVYDRREPRDERGFKPRP